MEIIKWLNKEPAPKIVKGVEGKYKINIYNEEDFRTLPNILEEKGIEWFNYENKHEKPNKVVMRGLAGSIDDEEIKTALIELGFKIINVLNIQIKKNDRHNEGKKIMIKAPLHMLTFDKDDKEDIKKIFDIKHILFTRVKIEQLRIKPEIVKQCKRCQGFGHTKNYCHGKVACVKCAGNHTSDKCLKGRNTTPKCVNCKQTGHVVSYRGCEVAKKVQHSRNKPLKNKRIKNQNQNQEKIVAQVQSKADINNTKLPKPVSQGKPEELTYAKISTDNSNQVNKQRVNQATDCSIEKMLRQILNKQEIIEKKFAKLESKVKTLVNRKNG